MQDDPIFVTRSALPPLDDFFPYLEKIWENNILTNNGPFHQQLEFALCEYLGVPYISLFNNGTIALMAALKALNLTGKVITTPYSFIATSHALLWNNLEPIFVDIDPNTFNIDPSKIEAAITSDTSAILGVHCYGYPCETDAISEIATRYQLKVLYDAAHAFGVKDSQGSILNYGDLSVLSFHATKVFNTFEGGAIVSHTKEMKDRIDMLRNFGFRDLNTVVDIGINGKLNEVSAAFGLLQLEYLNDYILSRKKIDAFYREQLAEMREISVPTFLINQVANYSYFPILINDNPRFSRDCLFEKFKMENIYVRKYFYPLITDFGVYSSLNFLQQDDLKIARGIASQVLCLPIYPDLSIEDQKRVVDVIKNI